MDPLSLTASIVAVVQAASAIAEGLQKILSLRNAPQEILQYMNEISDFRAVIALAQEIFCNIESEGHQLVRDVTGLMNQRLVQAMGTLNEVNDIICLISQSTPASSGLKISKSQWLRKSKKMKRLVASLRDTRSYISDTLNIITASGAPYARATLRGIVLESEQLNTARQVLEKRTLNQLSDIQPKLQEIHSSLQESKPLQHVTSLGASRMTSMSSNFQIQTSIYGESKCQRSCTCQCHLNITLTSPGWVRDLAGALLLGYHGAPLWFRRPCNEFLCQKEQKSLLDIAYIFPTWFLCRMIFMKYVWTPTHGHMVNIKTPRVVKENMTVPVFVFSVLGNTESMRALFIKGEASPFDVGCMSFNSPLHFAVNYNQISMCEFLLTQHADPYLLNADFESSIDRVWMKILTLPKHNPLIVDFKRIFGRFLDEKNDLQCHKFSTLHKIILNLSPISLIDQLQTSTSEVNIQCAKGLTPLHWAIRKNDLTSVQTLLNFGADISISDNYGCNSFQLATRKPELLKILFDTIITRNLAVYPYVSKTLPIEYFLKQKTKDGASPIEYASAQERTGASVALLLDHSADINQQGYGSLTPLLWAVINNTHINIRLLLSRGADQNIKSCEKMGVLHLAAGFGDLTTLEILLSEGVQMNGSEDIDIHGRTPLQVFEILRPTISVEDANTRANCRQVLLTILSKQPREQERDPGIGGKEKEKEKGIKIPRDTPENLEIFYDCEEGIQMIC